MIRNNANQPLNKARMTLCAVVAIASFAGAQAALAGPASPAIDDFSDAESNSLGLPRLVFTDASAGGQTTFDHEVRDGVLFARGEIVPPRGQPGWASMALPLNAEGKAVDASGFEGIRLRIRIKAGNVSVSANSLEVTNFDYHAAAATRSADGGFSELRIPFSGMKRAWSEQTPLDPATLGSISIVAFDLQRGEFDVEIDEVSFY